MQNENFFIDDPTGIDLEEKERAEMFLCHNIEQIYENSNQWTSIESENFEMTSKEVHRFIMDFRYNQNLSIKNPLINYSDVDDINELVQLYDYTGKYPEEEFMPSNQRIYFIEGRGCAISIIPIEQGNRNVTIFLELLDRSPKFIQALWKKQRERKDLRNIKFVKLEDL